MAVASLFEDLLDQYRIEQHIAKKLYTDQYQAYDVDDDRVVRLEILRADLAEDTSFAGRFVNRARALAQVRHPNIAQVLHIGKAAGGAPYVVQAEVDGFPLSYRLEQLAQRNTPVNVIYALNLIRQLADALLLAERLEIFHYDLRPNNVLLKNVTLPTDENVVLVDLFIPTERRLNGDQPGDSADTLGFLSPEQRAGREITAAGHIYSLGAMLYRLLAGQLPARPVTLKDTVFSHVFDRPTALERARPDLSAATYQLVDRSLRRDPRGRYPDIGTFITALDGALAAEEVRLGTAAARPPALEHRSLAWLLPILIVALFLAVGAVATRGLLTRAGASDPPTLTIPVSEGAGPAASATSPADPPTQPPAIGAVVSDESPTPANVELPSVPSPDPASPTPSLSPTTTLTPEPSATSTPSPTPAPPSVRVMLNLVNLRRGPGVIYPILGSVAGGERLEVLAWNNDEENPWFLVITDDQRVGWIAATVVQSDDVGALADVPIAATLPPTPLPSPTPVTPTATPTLSVTLPVTPDPDDPGGTELPPGTEPPDQPTDEPTEPPEEPTPTVPPLGTTTP
jgi:serine/threonine-protein kinase